MTVTKIEEAGLLKSKSFFVFFREGSEKYKKMWEKRRDLWVDQINKINKTKKHPNSNTNL